MSVTRSWALAAILLGAAVGSPGCAQTTRTDPKSNPVPIVLTIGFPQRIAIGKPPPSGPAPATNVKVQLKLTNNSDAPVTLNKANDCESHIWTVSDSAGVRIDDRDICPMIFMPVTETIPAHGTFGAAEIVMLDGAKYRDGGRYTLHYTFWGIAADAAFTTHIAQ
jgi:hypothetical protein